MRFKPGLIIFGGLVLMAVKALAKGASGANGSTGGGTVGGQLDLSHVEWLSHFRAHPDRLRRIVWLLQEWQVDGRLTADDAAVLLTWAYVESGYRLNARSADGSPDEAVGHSWSMFQISAETAQGYGIDIESLVVDAVGGGYRPEDIERATRANAHAILKVVFGRSGFTQGAGFLTWLRARYNADPALVARGLFIRASGGPARGWDYTYAQGRRPLVEVPPSDTPGTAGYIHQQIATRLGLLPYFRRLLGLPDIAPPSDLKVSPRLPTGERR